MVDSFNFIVTNVLEKHPKEDLATDVEVHVPDLPIFSKTQK